MTDTAAAEDVLRPHAEEAHAAELIALARADDRPRPANWRLSPWAVVEYLLGATLPDGTLITPKYVGSRRLMEIAVATLATDRALLLPGVPGTAKSWVSEHLAAAISGDSTLVVQGTAGTAEESVRYGWNYASLLAALDDRAAHEADVAALLSAVPPLARVQRYGDVRRTDSGRLAEVARAILGRACAGLPPAASGLADDAAGVLRAAIDGVQAVIGLLDDDTGALWAQTLRETAGRRDVPGIIAGRLVRLLLDTGDLDPSEAARRLSRALSAGTEPARQAGWVEGFLAGSPLLVIHDERLLALLDAWLTRIAADAFADALPILRRTFGSWDAAARRMLATRLAAPVGEGEAGAEASDIDWADAAPLLETVRLIMTPAKEDADA